MNRCFHIMAEFKALKKEEVEKLLERFFSSYTFTPEQKEKLFSYNSLTPGDFGTAFLKLPFMNAKEISSKMISDELSRMQEEKRGAVSKKIGFLK